MEQRIIEALNVRFHKIYKVSEGTHENKSSIYVEQLSNSNIFLGGFNSNNGVTYESFPKRVNLPMVELKKFDRTQVFTRVKKIEKYFELHNIMVDNQIIHITTLNFEIKPY